MATTDKHRIKGSSIVAAIAKARATQAVVLDIGETEPGERWYCIQSRTRPEKGYLLKTKGGKVTLCTCPAYESIRFCWHRVKLALQLGTVPQEWLAQFEGVPAPKTTRKPAVVSAASKGQGV